MGLSSLCGECVLQFLDKNKRLELFDRCPQIRPIDRRVPIKMDYLSVENCTIQIDQATYQIGIVRHYLNNVIPPKWVRKAEATGGIQKDNGDIHTSIFEQDRVPSIKEKQEKEDAEKKLLELLPKLKEDNLMYIQKSLERKVKYLQKIVRDYKEQVAISNLKYNSYIQLRRDKYDYFKHEYVLYQFPIQNAVDYIVNLLFRGRKIHMEPFTLIGTNLSIWPEKLTICVPKLDYEIQFLDGNLVSIKFPIKDVCFENLLDLEFNATRDVIRFKFEVKEKDLKPEILKILNVVEKPESGLAKVIDDIKNIEKSLFFLKHQESHRSRITIKKIESRDLSPTGGDYSIEFKYESADNDDLRNVPRPNRARRHIFNN
ncbi:hypothetical protein CAEBREN_18386 [Caenorhabditis brenneri]|uniref:Uncharacterized protein n=1 Tax=Caenorhabditis brenneri TaxID=135651 RepID=G0N499_CAEBE|nr:hypothetical protein CAEBREN_18386 [Caenorhabditis brenneri]